MVGYGSAIAVAFLASRALAGGAGGGGGAVPSGVVTGVVIVATLVGLKVAGLYRGSYREAGLAETARAVRAVVVGGVLGVGAALAVLGGALPAATCVLFIFFLLTLVGGARFLHVGLDPEQFNQHHQIDQHRDRKQHDMKRARNPRRIGIG